MQTSDADLFLEVILPETNSSHLKMDGWKTSFLLGWPIFSGYVRLFQLLQFEAASSEGFKSSRQIARTSCTSGHVGAPNSAYGS